MPEPLRTLMDGLRAIGAAPPLAVGLPGLAAAVWALALWADEARPRTARRTAAVAGVLIGFGLLLRLGLAMNQPQPLLAPWQWLGGVLVLPLFMRRGTRWGGAATMLFFLCLAVALATAVGWAADVPLASAAALLGGVVALVAAVALNRLLPRRSDASSPAAAPAGPE